MYSRFKSAQITLGITLHLIWMKAERPYRDKEDTKDMQLDGNELPSSKIPTHNSPCFITKRTWIRSENGQQMLAKQEHYHLSHLHTLG